MDANSHHVIWGSSNINSRGEALLEYIASTNLDILNRGDEPTFVTSNRREVIDLTLASQNLGISRWRVSREDSASDHRYITFEMALDAVEEVVYRNPKLTNWKVCKEKLDQSLNLHLGEIRTQNELVKEINRMVEKVKYLGILFDSKMSFSQHLEERFRKSTMILWQLRRTFSKIWGLSPKMVSWIYTCVVKPYLAYGVVVWWARAQFSTYRTMLSKLQRLA